MITKGASLEPDEFITPEQIKAEANEEQEKTDHGSIEAFFSTAAAVWGPRQ